jgi:chromosome segregation ATPase
MGRHIRIKKPEWTSQIERTLGGNLEAFVVTCKEDQALLSDMMKRVKCSSSIFIGHSTRLDTAGKEPVESVDTILRVLQIDNDLVWNSLIINQAAEQVVLIPDRNEAERFMYSGERPRNVKAALAFAERDRREAIRFEFSGRGAEKSSFVAQWEGQPRMRTDLEDQTRMQREQRDQAGRDFEHAKQDVRGLQTALERAKQGIVRFDRRTKDLKTQYQQAEDAIEHKQAEIESNQPQDGRLQELERQLSEAKDELEAQEQSFQDMTNAKDDLNATQRQVKDRLDGATEELNQGRARVNKAEKRLEKLETARINALREKNLALEMIDDAKRTRDDLQERAETQQGTVDQFVEMAQQISRRIPVEESLTSDIIDRRIDKFIKERERAEAEAGGTIEDLLLAWQRAKNEYEEAKAQTHEMQVFAKVCHHHMSTLVPV